MEISRKSVVSKALFELIILNGISGCNKTTPVTTSATSSQTTTTTTSASLNPSFSTEVQSVFDANCISAGCHDGAQVPDLRSTNSFAALNQTSTEDATKYYVSPGNATISYLYIKLTSPGSSGIGFKIMPNDATLPQIQIDTVKNWINAGAYNN